MWRNRVFFIVGNTLSWIDFSKGIVSTNLPPDALVDQSSIGFYDSSLTIVHNSKSKYYLINLDDGTYEPTLCDRYVSFKYVNIRHLPTKGDIWVLASHYQHSVDVHYVESNEHRELRLPGETSEFLCVSEGYAVMASLDSKTPTQEKLTFVSIYMNGKLGEFSIPPTGARPRDGAFFATKNDNCAAIISGGKLYFGTIHQPGSKITFKGPFTSPLKWNAYTCLSLCENGSFLLLVSQSAIKPAEQTIVIMDLEQPDDATGSFAIIGTFPLDTQHLGTILKIRANVEQASAPQEDTKPPTMSAFALTAKGLLCFTLE